MGDLQDVVNNGRLKLCKINVVNAEVYKHLHTLTQFHLY
jgi:hypothetical protein